jgi:D-methionine transport system ATP-binding protein
LIKAIDVNKNFGINNVLKDVNLNIKSGEILGIIGQSGAGKSTLLRCINGLEKFDLGTMEVMGREILSLNDKDMRSLRKEVAMIFQHFSLLERKNVFDNIAFPMRCWKYKEDVIREKVEELLKVVGLYEKRFSKPRELSGGQKQRVAIARALTLMPKILLCDEATSALDPNTTKEILDLIREINERYGITIVMVTHEMEVIKQVCHRVAIMNNGVIEAVGKVEEIFLSPQRMLKSLISDEEVVLEKGVNLKIYFSKYNSRKSVITEIARKLDIDISIVFGKLEKFKDDVLGSLIINIDEKNFKAVAKCLEDKEITWEVVGNE